VDGAWTDDPQSNQSAANRFGKLNLDLKVELNDRAYLLGSRPLQKRPRQEDGRGLLRQLMVRSPRQPSTALRVVHGSVAMQHTMQGERLPNPALVEWPHSFFAGPLRVPRKWTQ
jgi:hypothetical protein